MTRNRWRLAFAALFAVGTLAVQPGLRAQDLKDELDALEEPPEDDLSGLDSAGSSAAAPKPAPSAPAADPLESLPVDGEAAASKSADLDSLAAPGADEDLPEPDDVADKKEAVGLEEESQAVSETPPPVEPSPTDALTGGAASEPAGKLTSLNFKQLPDRVRLVLSGDRAMDWTRELRSKRRQIVVELKNMSIAREVLKRALDTGEFDGPVALVQAFESKVANVPTVKVLFQLRQFVDPSVLRSGNDIYVDFPIVTDGNLFRERAQRQPTVPKTFLSATGKLSFKGNKISLNVKDADLQDVLNLISRSSGKDFILGTGVGSAKVTLNVRNTPWDQVLAIILLNAKLGYQEIAGTYRILPIADLKTELDDAAKTAQQAEDLTPLETRLYPISYAKATDINTNIGDFKTKRGKSSVDARTNTLVVTDTPETLEKVGRYIRSVDKQTSQVLIEGRIVEARQDFSQNLGIEWKIGEMNGSKLQDSFVNLGRTAEGAGGGVLKNTTDNARYRDLTTTGERGGARFKLGELGSLGAIQALLKLSESERKTRTIASPRITVLDNKQATISQGTQIAVVTPPAQAGGAPTTTYVPAELRLEVTPQVTADGHVLMKIALNRDEPASATSTSINTRRAETELLIESGKTAVIGGIYTIDKNQEESGWPGLRNVPVFGQLFRDSKTITEASNELLMFISPRILNADKALMMRSESLGQEQRNPLLSSGSNDEEVPDDTL
jgi:type IV pilus assembly protein PilQ